MYEYVVDPYVRTFHNPNLAVAIFAPISKLRTAAVLI